MDTAETLLARLSLFWNSGAIIETVEPLYWHSGAFVGNEWGAVFDTVEPLLTQQNCY